MLELLSYPSAFGAPSPSPFCVKAMCLLEMSGADWRPKWLADPRKTPNRKLPVLIDGGVPVADSHFIRLHLERTLGVDFDAGLSDADRAVSRAATRMLEEHLYWAIVSDRWLDEGNWPTLRDAYFAAIPKLVRGLIAERVRKQIRAQMEGHGIGRHSASDIAALGIEDLQVLETLLGDKPFVMGDKPSAIDATAGPFAAGAASAPSETELSRYAKSSTRLTDYAVRVRDAIYPPADKIQVTDAA